MTDRERLAQEFADFYDTAPCGYLTFRPDRSIVRANRTLLRWLGRSADELLAGLRFPDLLTPGGRIFFETHLAPLLELQQKVHEIALDLKCADDTRLSVLVDIVAVPGPDGPHLYRATIFDITERRAYERELLAARRAAERSTERLGVLQRITAEMAAASDAAGIAAAVERAARVALGVDACAIYLADHADDRALRPVTAAGRADLRLPAAISVTDDSPHAVAFRSGRTAHVRRSEVVGTHAGLAARLAANGHEALYIVPFVPRAGTAGHGDTGLVATETTPGRRRAGGSTIGGSFGPARAVSGIVVYAFRADEPASEDDLVLLGTLTEQAHAALVRAVLGEAQRELALALQESLLAHETPTDPRVRFSVQYLPATTGVDVGGDWYDTFAVEPDADPGSTSGPEGPPGGRIALVVGDVVGRGADAAAAMGQLRSAGRALLQSGIGPAAVLRHLDTFAAGVPNAFCTTVLCAVLDPATGEFRYASAGHLPPLLVDDGGARFLDAARGAPLAVVPGTLRTEHVEQLAPGSLLVLCTDGLVERRQEAIDVGLDRLASVVTELGPAVTAAAIVERLVPDGAADDACVLCVWLTATTRRTEGVRA